MRNISLQIGVLFLAGGLIALGLAQTARSEGGVEACPEGYVSVVQIEPLRSGEGGSKTVGQHCQLISEAVATVVLQPLSPEEAQTSEIKPSGVSPIVRGPSQSSEHRCVVVLEPLRDGETSSIESYQSWLTDKPACRKKLSSRSS